MPSIPSAVLQEELRVTLDAAGRTLRRLLHERATGGVPPEAASLPDARDRLLRCATALEPFSGSAKLLYAMASLVQSYASHPQALSEASAAAVERASDAVIEHLAALARGKQVSAVALFPQYRELLMLLGEERVHPAELWTPPQAAVRAAPAVAFPLEGARPAGGTVGAQQIWTWVDGTRVDNAARAALKAEPLAYVPALRSRMDTALLQMVKAGGGAAALPLRDITLGLAAGETQLPRRAFWQLASAYFEALALELIAADVYVKRTASRVLLQYSAFSRDPSGAAVAVADGLAQDLLFFCAQAAPAHLMTAVQAAPVLATVRRIYGLSDAQPVNYEAQRYGRFDPTALAQARQRIRAALEGWAGFNTEPDLLYPNSIPDNQRFEALTALFSQLGVSLLTLQPERRELVRALLQAADYIARAASWRPSLSGARLATEVDLALCFLDAAYEDLDPEEDMLKQERGDLLALRIDRAVDAADSGVDQPAEPFLPWMAELLGLPALTASVFQPLFELEHEGHPFQPAPAVPSAPRAGSRTEPTWAPETQAMPNALQDAGPAVDPEDAHHHDTSPSHSYSTSDPGGPSDSLGVDLADAVQAAPVHAESMGQAGQEPDGYGPEFLGGLEPDTESGTTPDPVLESVLDATPDATPDIALDPHGSLPESTALQASDARPAEPVLTETWFGEPSPTEIQTETDAGAVPPPAMSVLTQALAGDSGLDTFLAVAREAVHAGLDAVAAQLAGMFDTEPVAQIAPGADGGGPLVQAFEPLAQAATDAQEAGVAEAEELVRAVAVLSPFLSGSGGAGVRPEVLHLVLEALHQIGLWVEDLAAGREPPALVDALQQAAAALASPAPSSAPSVSTTDLDPVPDEPALDLAALEPVGAAAMAPERVATAYVDSAPAFSKVGSDGDVSEDGGAAQQDTTPLGDVSGLGDPSEPQPFRQARFVDGEAQFKQIGPLRLPLADYKAFLNEADEWSRLLSAGLNEWSLDLGHQVRRALPVNLLALAHALAGSAAGLGLEAIATLARTLEQAMTQQRGERELQVPATEAARIFLLAAEDIRYLLHQLTAGELKMPEPGLLDELAAAAGLDAPVLLAPASPSALSASADLLGSGLSDPRDVVSEEPDLFSSAAPQAGSPNEWGYASLPDAASAIDAPGLASAPSALPLRQRLEARVDEVHGGLHELDLMLERLRVYLKSAGLPPEALKEIATVQRHLQEALGELEEDLRELDDKDAGGP